MRDAVGSRLEVKYGPTRHGDVKDSMADITRARTLLGYEPSVSLEAGLKKTLDWYRKPN
jgi:UDP-N-acetylglucosamine 4-epimerase